MSGRILNESLILIMLRSGCPKIYEYSQKNIEVNFIFNEFDDFMIFDSEREIYLEISNRFQGTNSLNILDGRH